MVDCVKRCWQFLLNNYPYSSHIHYRMRLYVPHSLTQVRYFYSVSMGCCFVCVSVYVCYVRSIPIPFALNVPKVLCFCVENEPNFCYAICNRKPSLLSQTSTKVSLLFGPRSQTIVHWMFKTLNSRVRQDGITVFGVALCMRVHNYNGKSINS